MERNVGGLDRVFRIAGGWILIVALAYEPFSHWNNLIGVFALYCIITGTLEVCPIFNLLHINTANTARR
ncbi:MAG: DUF2892 domain-containing protein [Candidatus Hydrothermarchaeales archaeon]